MDPMASLMTSDPGPRTLPVRTAAIGSPTPCGERDSTDPGPPSPVRVRPPSDLSSGTRGRRSQESRPRGSGSGDSDGCCPA